MNLIGERETWLIVGIVLVGAWLIGRQLERIARALEELNRREERRIAEAERLARWRASQRIEQHHGKEF